MPTVQLRRCQPNHNRIRTPIQQVIIVFETTEEDLYGDWLVVNRKKNQGKKTRVNTQEEKQDTQGKSKPIGKSGMFSHLADAGIIENSGTLFHAMGSKFQPGELSEIPKVWTKKTRGHVAWVIM
jgi:hypothetical protein